MINLSLYFSYLWWYTSRYDLNYCRKSFVHNRDGTGTSVAYLPPCSSAFLQLHQMPESMMMWLINFT